MRRVSVVPPPPWQYHFADSCTSRWSFSALLPLSQKSPNFCLFICFPLPVCVPLHLPLSHFTLLLSDHVSSYVKITLILILTESSVFKWYHLQIFCEFRNPLCDIPMKILSRTGPWFPCGNHLEMIS